MAGRTLQAPSRTKGAGEDSTRRTQEATREGKAHSVEENRDE